MYPKKDYFSFIFIEMTHNIDIILGKKNYTAADNVASLLIFHCILGRLKDTALDMPSKDES